MNDTDPGPGHSRVRGEDKYVLIQCNEHPMRKNTPDEYLCRFGRPACFQEEVVDLPLGETR